MSMDPNDRDPVLGALREADPLRQPDDLAGPGSSRAAALLESVLSGRAAPEPIFPEAPLGLHAGVELSVQEGIATLAFDDGRANVLSREILVAFEEATLLCEAEADVGALILLGRPGFFSAGLDRRLAFARRSLAVRQFAAVASCVTRLLAAEIPVVAACTGHAIAAGAFLLLAADARVGVRGAYRVGFNETAIGLPFPGWGRELARTRLAREQFEGATRGAQLFPPGAALKAGFLDELVEPADLERVARERAVQLAGEGRDAYAARLDEQRGALVEAMERRWRRDLPVSE